MDKKNITFSINIPDKLLLAANKLKQNGRHPFSAEDLVVSAWRMFPDSFGLAGHKDDNGKLRYPDSNRVFAEIMGSKPIRKKGYLVKVGEKMYQITSIGEQVAKSLARESVGKKIPVKAGLAHDLKNELKQLLASKAFTKFRNGRELDITFNDACAFWGISSRSKAIELAGKHAKLLKIIQTAKASVRSDAATFEHRGLAYSSSDLEKILKSHEFMLAKFSNDLKIIRNRKDERT